MEIKKNTKEATVYCLTTDEEVPVQRTQTDADNFSFIYNINTNKIFCTSTAQ